MSQSHQSKLKELYEKNSVLGLGIQDLDNSLPLLVVKASQAVYRCEGEEEKHRVEKDEAGDDHPGHVCSRLQVSIFWLGKVLKHYAPHNVIRVTRFLVQ